MNNDGLEVKLSDQDFHIYYKKRVRIGDTKEMEVLFKDLSQKGLNFNLENKSAKWRFKVL